MQHGALRDLTSSSLVRSACLETLIPDVFHTPSDRVPLLLVNLGIYKSGEITTVERDQKNGTLNGEIRQFSQRTRRDQMQKTQEKSDIEKIAKMIKDIDFGMLTTVNEDGTLHSRPMSANRNVEFDGDVWFFTYGSSHKVIEAQKNPNVNVSFSDIKGQTYVSLSGTAELVRDQAKIKELWEPILKAWFPEGLDTPDLALLKVSAQKAEYWDSPGNFISKTIELVRALSGQPVEIGENKKIDLK